MTFETTKEIDITVQIESYHDYHHSCDRMQPDDTEEIEISAFIMTKIGNKTYKIELTDLQIEALNLEAEALDYVKQQKLENRIEQALNREPVPDRLREALGIIASSQAGRQL